MHLLHFGTYEEILYPYVKFELKGDEIIDNESDFVQQLLDSADNSGNSVVRVIPSATTRYKKGDRAIPEKAVMSFHKAGARDIVIENLNCDVVPKIAQGRKQQLIEELVNVVRQDTTIDDEFKASVLGEATQEHLSAFLADLLIYAVGIDPTERDKEYPVENYNIPVSNDWFTGREEELEEIERNFVGGCRVQILYGMGGMGKSQLARKYAYDHYRSYSLIHWINASTLDSIVECYKAFLTEKKIAPADQTTEAICQSYTNYMDSHSDWLLIYDNCDYYTDKEYADFSELCLPKNRSVGNILITTRNKRSIGKAKRIEVGVLSGEDAVAFLIQRTELDDSAGAEQLAERLGRFPLALEIAGAYINATPGCNFQTYLGYLEQETKILGQMVEVTNYNETIKDILLLTMKRIREDRGGDTVSLCVEDALHLFSYGAPYDINLKTLGFLDFEGEMYDEFIGACATTENHFKELKDICSDALKRNELARTLVTYGLMAEQPDGLLAMHELQQEVLKNDISPESDWARFLYAALCNYPTTEDKSWLHFSQHETYMTKHWMELSHRLGVSPWAVACFTLRYRRSQVELLMQQIKTILDDNPDMSQEEFEKLDDLLQAAIRETTKAYYAAEQEETPDRAVFHDLLHTYTKKTYLHIKEVLEYLDAVDAYIMGDASFLQ